ncbi:GNAT family N-acetyltransferase [Aureispira sp. CCB-QB1]|uniref:GNAT family N-acetyltransferase n=1 Tax=Aureispira sp. CCB-QB1 TaxID=1313421 RepID=UPI0006983B5D|nr:GNAT family N-acetyltransferase [Aureispira sp. CCB-QB1]
MLYEVYLKKLQVQTDAEHLYHLIATSQTVLEEWLPSWGKIASIAASKEHIAQHEQSDFYWGEEQYGIWLNQQLIGQVSLHSGQMENQTVKLSYFLGIGAQGKGYMTRACSLLISKVFEEEKIQSVIIECEPSNISSQKLAKRLGFECLSSHSEIVLFIVHQSDWIVQKHISLYFLWFLDVEESC